MHLILLVLGGRLYKSFEQWRELTRVHGRRVVEQARARILKLYRSRLQAAWTLWVHVLMRQKKNMRMAANEQWMRETIWMQNELQKAKLGIEDFEMRSLQQGKKVINKVLMKIFRYNIGYRFHRWHAAVKDHEHQLAVAERVLIVKVQRRTLKLAFRRYRGQVKRQRREDNGEMRSEDYEKIIRYKALKRMFRAIKKFSAEHHVAKINLKKLLIYTDLKTKKCLFQLWKQEVNIDVLQVRVSAQAKKVGGLQGALVLAGNLQSVAHDQGKELCRLEALLVSLGRKTLAKNICRFKMYTIYAAFITWRGKVAQYNTYRQRLKYQVMQRRYCRVMPDAFFSWSLVRAAARKERSFLDLHQVQMHQAHEEELLAGTRSKRAHATKVARELLARMKEEQNYHHAKVRNTIEKISRDKLNNDSINRRQHVFNVWKHYVQDKRRGLKKLVALIEKSNRQTALDGIKQISWEERARSHKQSLIRKLAFVLTHRY